MKDDEVTVALGVQGDAPWELVSPAVEVARHDDVMKSAKRDVEALLQGPPVAPLSRFWVAT